MQEFRPRRLVWKGPDRFLLVGLTKSSELQRSFLRFKTAGEASRAASTIRETWLVVEEPLVPVEEIEVQVRVLYSLGQFVITYMFSFRLVLVGFIVYAILSVFGSGMLAPAILVSLYVALYVWAFMGEEEKKNRVAQVRGKIVCGENRTGLGHNCSESDRMEEYSILCVERFWNEGGHSPSDRGGRSPGSSKDKDELSRNQGGTSESSEMSLFRQVETHVRRLGSRTTFPTRARGV